MKFEIRIYGGTTEMVNGKLLSIGVLKDEFFTHKNIFGCWQVSHVLTGYCIGTTDHPTRQAAIDAVIILLLKAGRNKYNKTVRHAMKGRQ